MPSLRAGCVSILWLFAVTIPLNAQETTPAQDGQAIYDRAAKAFNAGQLDEAHDLLRQYLWSAKPSPLVAEARYKLYLVYTLRGNTPAAKEQADVLVREQLKSPWTEAVLRHYPAKELFDLARSKRNEALKAPSAERFAIAASLFRVFRVSHPLPGEPGATPAANGWAPNKYEVIYSLGDSSLRAGDPTARAALEYVRTDDKEGDWGKLAKFRLQCIDLAAGMGTQPSERDSAASGGDAALLKGLEALLHSNATEESSRLFLDFAERACAHHSWPERSKGLYLTGWCYDRLDNKAAAAETYKKVIQEFPHSQWAGESAFWLAELSFAQGDFKSARYQYISVCRDYPDHPRAAKAKEWAGWLDHVDPAWNEVGTLLQSVLSKLKHADQGLAAQIRYRGADDVVQLELKLALSGKESALMELKGMGQECVICSSADGCLYHIGAGEPFVRTRKPVEFPMPSMSLQADANNKFSFSYGMAFGAAQGANKALTVDAPISLAPILALVGRSAVHVTVVRHGDSGAKAFLFEMPKRAGSEPSMGYILVDQERVLKVRLVIPQPEGDLVHCEFDHILLGEKLPEECFEYKLPANAVVREVDAISTMDLIGQCLRVGGALAEKLGNKKKPKSN